ncbi:MAG: hypothetical protein JRF37_03845 [Deltaproteobacteria bacterium]|nr:hypothetical protein [Deltaproteobacteria bacterium]
MPEVEGWLRLGVDLNGSLNKSNQNYYDGLGTISLADDVFLDDYYNYNSYRIRPNVSYTFALIPLTPSFSYSYQRLDYTDRKAQSADGTYSDDNQHEVQQVTSLGLRYRLFENCSVYTQWQHTAVKSNNDDESVYKYDHTVDNYYAGMSFRF